MKLFLKFLADGEVIDEKGKVIAYDHEFWWDGGDEHLANGKEGNFVFDFSLREGIKIEVG